MAVTYVKVEVSLHGLNAESAESIRKEIHDVLRSYYHPAYESDIAVELIESAGSI